MGRAQRTDGRVVLTGHVHTGSAAAHRLADTAMAAASDMTESTRLLELVLHSLDQDSAEEVVAIDLTGKSPVSDHMVICSGRSSRHVAAIAEKLIERVKHDAGVLPRTEGKDTGDWVLIDAGDVIVHIFRPEVRAFYQLEKMWQTPADATARHA